ncbi:MAG: DUF2218 domain-containing protein [Pseudomonadota bacterium]
MKTFARFETDRASRYLASLCHHFGRKVDAACDANSGWVQFPFGRCEMVADESQLDLMAAAETDAHLDQVVQIVTNHLERFAFRENPTLDWQEQRGRHFSAIV